MGMITRLIVPRGVRRAMHPARTVRRAVTPRTIKRARRVMHPGSNVAYGIERTLTGGRRRRFRYRSGSSGGSGGGGASLLGLLVAFALVWLVIAWPWMVATTWAKRHGNPPGSATYTTVGWLAEGSYLAVLLLIIVAAARRSRRRRAARSTATLAEQARRAAVDAEYVALHPDPPPARHAAPEGARHAEPQPWLATRVEQRYTPSGATYYGHGGCGVRHRTADAAHRCTAG